MLIKKLDTIIAAYKEDMEALEMINDMLKSCRRYVDTIISQSSILKVQKFRLLDSEYKELLKSTQETRSLTHNAMCHLIKIVNRLAIQKELDVPYTGSNHRIDYALFARDLCMELFNIKCGEHDLDF